MSATILDTGPPGQGVPTAGNRGRRRKTIDDAGNDASNTRVARIGHQKQLQLQAFPDSASTQGKGELVPAVILTSTEVKLLHLILDKNAADGEVTTGSVKLVQSLRRRGVEAEEIENAFAKSASGEAIAPGFRFDANAMGQTQRQHLRGHPAELSPLSTCLGA
jgi:hypothetical protein